MASHDEPAAGVVYNNGTGLAGHSIVSPTWWVLPLLRSELVAKEEEGGTGEATPSEEVLRGKSSRPPEACSWRTDRSTKTKAATE
jgi:hypothetical protein